MGEVMKSPVKFPILGGFSRLYNDRLHEMRCVGRNCGSSALHKHRSFGVKLDNFTVNYVPKSSLDESLIEVARTQNAGLRDHFVTSHEIFTYPSSKQLDGAPNSATFPVDYL